MWWVHFQSLKLFLGEDPTHLYKIRSWWPTYLPVSDCPLQAPLTYLTPSRNTHLFYHIWTWKVSKTWEQYSLTTSYCSEDWWKFPWISMVLEVIFTLGEYMYWTHLLKLPYLDIQRSGLNSWLKVRARAEQLTCLKVKAIYHIWNKMDIWRSRLVIWPPLLN